MFLALTIVIARGPPAARGELATGRRDAEARCRAIELLETESSGFLPISCVE